MEALTCNVADEMSGGKKNNKYVKHMRLRLNCFIHARTAHTQHTNQKPSKLFNNPLKREKKEKTNDISGTYFPT